MNNIVKINNISKIYRMYKQPYDRVKEVFNVSKKSYHDDFYALRNISLEIKKGENIGIIGKNGSGKSTLLKIISGIILPSNGDVSVNGRISAILELGAGFNPDFNGIENIFSNGMIMGFSRKQMEDRLEKIIEFADLGEFIYQPVKTYSSGMYARLAFSVAINIDPDILIVDEALSVGDMGFQHKCMNKMKELIEKGVSIIFVSHDTFAIKSLCKRCIYLKDGQIMADGNAIDVTDMYLMDTRKKIYSVEDKIIEEANQIMSMNLENNDEELKIEEVDETCIPDSKNEVHEDEKVTNKYDTLRYGTGNLRIKNVVMKNSKGEVSDHFSHNETMNIEITAKSYKRVENLNCCIRIRDKNGIDVTGTTTFEEGIKIGVIEKDKTIKFNFKAPNILKHDMTFSLGVTLNDTISIVEQEILDHVDVAYTFKSIYNTDRPVWYTYYQDFDIEYDIN